MATLEMLMLGEQRGHDDDFCHGHYNGQPKGGTKITQLSENTITPEPWPLKLPLHLDVFGLSVLLARRRQTPGHKDVIATRDQSHHTQGAAIVVLRKIKCHHNLATPTVLLLDPGWSA